MENRRRSSGFCKGPHVPRIVVEVELDRQVSGDELWPQGLDELVAQTVEPPEQSDIRSKPG